MLERMVAESSRELLNVHTFNDRYISLLSNYSGLDSGYVDIDTWMDTANTTTR